MKVTPTALPEVLLVEPQLFADPRAQRTSLAMPGWKCMPRSTPRAEREWLSCTNCTSTPVASRKARWLKLSKKKPRASPKTFGSSSTTSGMARRVAFTATPSARAGCA